MKILFRKRPIRILGKIIFELIPVIIGILIALLINDYREKLKAEKQVKVLLTNLVGEFSERREEISEIIKNRQQPFLDTLEQYIDDTETPVVEIFMKVGGFGFPDVYTVSWETALSSQDISSLDFKLIALLSKISSSQADLDSRVDKFYSYIYSPNAVLNNTEPFKKEQLRILVSDYIGSEQTLIERYDEFISLTDSLHLKQNSE